MNLVFDVDKTLTPPRQPITLVFHDWFIEWITKVHKSNNKIYLLAGSPYKLIIEQLGHTLCDNYVDGVYGCQGNTLHIRGEEIYRLVWNSDKIVKYLNELLSNSEYPIRTGFHIDIRPGMINFSTVGRNANKQQRQDYYEWDKINGERKRIVKKIEGEFPEVEARIGGMVSIDIGLIGCDKGQVKNKLVGPIWFFADSAATGGIDEPLAKLLQFDDGDRLFVVKDYAETWEFLIRLI